MHLQRLDWDSEFWKVNYYNLVIDSENELVTPFFPQKRKFFIQYLAEITETEAIGELIRHGFQFIDLKMNFERVISQVPTSGMHELVKVAAIPDIQELTEISQSVLIKDSRFNNNFFDIELVKRFYKIWTEKAVNGQFDDGCLAYQHDGQKVGFITYKIISDTANIGLLAVHPNFHSQGIGQTLIRSLISFLDKTKIHKVTVSTEGRNLGAQRFYTRNSFTPSSIQAWLYSDDRDMPLEINPG